MTSSRCCVIAIVYSAEVAVGALLIAAGIFALILLVRAARVRYGLVYFLLAAAAWVALFESGIDPIVLGLADGSDHLGLPGRTG